MEIKHMRKNNRRQIQNIVKTKAEKKINIQKVV